MFKTYCIVNEINGSKYYGYTSKSTQLRFNEHKSYSNRKKDQLLQKAFLKYGIENFCIEEIELFDNKEDALSHERYLIETFKTNRLRYPVGNGYNMTDGGDNPPNHKGKKLNNSEKLKNRKLSEDHRTSISKGLDGHITCQETKDKISESNTGKHLTEETKDKLSDFRKDITYKELYGENADSIKDKISDTMKGRNWRNEKILIVYSTGEEKIFKSCVEAAKYLNISAPVVRYRIKKENKFSDFKIKRLG